MHHELIENLLAELQQLPRQHRTPEKVLANLMLAATAAGVSLGQQAAPLQIEHMQLSAALDRLAEQLGSDYQARAMLRLGAGLEGVELGGVLEAQDSASSLPRFIAFGTTARTVLANLTREIRAAGPAKPTPRRRLTGSLSLKSLANQLDDAA